MNVWTQKSCDLCEGMQPQTEVMTEDCQAMWMVIRVMIYPGTNKEERMKMKAYDILDSTIDRQKNNRRERQRYIQLCSGQAYCTRSITMTNGFGCKTSGFFYICNDFLLFYHSNHTYNKQGKQKF